MTTQNNAAKPALIATCWVHMGATVPFSGRMWSPIPFRYRVEQVAQAGFAGIGINVDDIVHTMEMEAPGKNTEDKLKWMKDVLDENGLTTNELEVLAHWMLPESDPRRQAEQPIRELLLKATEIIRPRHVKTCNILGHIVDSKDANREFLKLCSEFEARNAIVGYEIMPIDVLTPTMEQALEVVRGAQNGGLFLDTWHINNIDGISYRDIEALSPGDVAGVELDDGWLVTEEYKPFFKKVTAPGFIEMTVNCRRPCGEGNFDMDGFIRAVVASGFTGPWGSEVLSEELRRLPVEMAVRHIFKTSDAAVNQALSGD